VDERKPLCNGTGVMVLSPTRELALQIYGQGLTFAHFSAQLESFLKTTTP
jgi:superfamily II DNA/RNA helicase